MVANYKNRTDAMSIIHSSAWARMYATFADEAGVPFAVFHADYPGMQPSDRSARIVRAAFPTPSGSPEVDFNYRSNFGWLDLPEVVAAGCDAERAVSPPCQMLFHCHAMGLQCDTTTQDALGSEADQAAVPARGQPSPPTLQAEATAAAKTRWYHSVAELLEARGTGG